MTCRSQFGVHDLPLPIDLLELYLLNLHTQFVFTALYPRVLAKEHYSFETNCLVGVVKYGHIKPHKYALML